MRAHANLIDQRAKEEEHRLMVQKGIVSLNNKLGQASQAFSLQAVEREIAVNDIYIESINAKL
jgi:hypothetical protein